MSIQRRHGTRFERGDRQEVEDDLTMEAPLQVSINGEPFTITMRTPGDDEALVRGLLFTEGIISREAGGYAYTDRAAEGTEGTRVAEVEIPEIYLCPDFMNRRSLVSTSSCGLCGKKTLADIAIDEGVAPPAAPLDMRMVPDLPGRMRAAQHDFSQSGGCHAAAAFTASGELLRLAEDVGRHNAVDKVIGHLLKEKRLGEAAVLQVSGRISFEIVSKCCKAGIVFLSAVSAPSSMAVELGEQLGMTIIGFCREDRATVYSHPENAAYPG